MADKQDDLLVLTSHVVSNFVANNSIGSAELPGLIASVYSALGSVGSPPPPVEEPGPERPTSAQVRRSIQSEALISFEDGKPYRTLKRHLAVRGLTMDEYRAKWGLQSSYPSVAPGYSQARSEMAKALGLGQKGRGRKSSTKPATNKPGRNKKTSS